MPNELCKRIPHYLLFPMIARDRYWRCTTQCQSPGSHRQGRQGPVRLPQEPIGCKGPRYRRPVGDLRDRNGRGCEAQVWAQTEPVAVIQPSLTEFAALVRLEGDIIR